MSDLVVIARFRDGPEAHIARSLLESEGLMAFVAETEALGALPHLIFGQGGYRLQVASEDVDAALAILRDAQLAPPLEE
ncbi:MAG: DUF2007 domain-containing protein [Hydrogenophilaceae bacterium]|jgi:hypothetical protein|nr:DUF2007 domain-containing protein [Hydrogenophilaceae bacterium]